MKLNANGLIIKELPVGERDKMVTLLTAEQGIIRAFATGAMSIKGKNNAATQLFCYGRYTINKTKETYRISESEPTELFYKLRGDIVSLSLAQYFCELCGFFAPEQDTAADFMRLMLNSLKILNDNLRPPILLKPHIELRMLSYAGYMPALQECTVCGRQSNEKMCFDTLGGTLVCTEHNTGAEPVSPSVLCAMRHIIYSDLKDSYSFTLSEKSFLSLGNITQRFLLSQADRGFKTLEFYNEILG